MALWPADSTAVAFFTEGSAGDSMPGFSMAADSGRFHEASFHRFAGSFWQDGWRNEFRNGLSATGLGLLIQARLASYFDGLLEPVSH